MSYERLAKKARISFTLYEAIKLEEEISDLLNDDYRCDSEELTQCYAKVGEFSKSLTDFEKFVVGGVGKTLWRERVLWCDSPETHPEYIPAMHSEIYGYLERVHKFSDREQHIAQQIIDNVSLQQTMPRQLLAA